MAAYITVPNCVRTALRGRYYVYLLQRLSAIAIKRRYYYYYLYFDKDITIYTLYVQFAQKFSFLCTMSEFTDNITESPQNRKQQNRRHYHRIA